MSISILSGLTAEWFTPPSQAGQANPAQFLLKPLTGVQRLDALGLVADGQNGAATVRALSASMQGWRGVMDGEKELEFSVARIEMLPLELLVEIFGEVVRRSKLTESERKN